MKPSLRRRLHLLRAILFGVGIAAVPEAVYSQAHEYVVTFHNVSVRGVDIVDTPDVAHRESPGLEKLQTLTDSTSDRNRSEERAGTAFESGTGVDPLKRVDGGLSPLPKISLRLPGSLLPSEPGQGIENPSFVQEGFLVEAFWAGKIGRREGFFKRAHFHPPDLSTGFEAQHLGNFDELHGIYIRSIDGKRFGLKSLKYRVTRNRQMPWKSVSIESFSNYNVNILVARSFDPRLSIRSQFIPFPVGLPMGNDTSLPWWTQRITGFSLVEQVFIASSASVDFNDIVLTRSELPSRPSDQ